MARLTIVENDRSRIYDICEDVVRIGSGSDNNIELEDPAVSKNHCEIRRTPKGFKVIDLESKKGTRVNAEFVNQQILEPGDKISIGRAVVCFEGEKPVRATAPPRSGAAGSLRSGSSARRPVAPRSRRVRFSDDEGSRARQERSGLPGWAQGILALGGAVVIFAVIFGIISSSSKDAPGVTRIRQAQVMIANDEYEAALAKLKEIDGESGVPAWAVGEKDEMIAECQRRIDGQLDWRLHKEAREDINEIIRFLNDYPIEVQEINRRLDVVEQKYRDKGDLLSRLEPDITRLRKRFPLKNDDLR